MVKKQNGFTYHRKKAGSGLSEIDSEDIVDLTKKDAVKLLHELKANQAELQILNEKLRMQRDSAEEATKKYSDLYSEIYDFTPVAYFCFSPDGKILELNLKASELLGIERSKLTNKNFKPFLTPESRPVFVRCLQSLFTNEGKTGCEIQIIRPDNSIIYARVEGTLSELENKCLAMVIDITETRRMEEALRKSEKNLYRAQEIAKTGNWQLDLNQDKLNWSEQVYRIFGVPEGKSLNFGDFLSMVYADDRDYVKAKWESALAGADYDIEHRIVANGKIKWVREKAFLEFNEEGKLMHGIGIVQDITDKKTLELDLVDSHKKLKERNETIRQQLFELENLYNNSPVGLCVFDLDYHYIRINERLAEINGIPAKDHIGKTIAEIVPDLNEKACQVFKKILETGEPQTGIEFTGSTASQPGVLRYFTENWTPILTNGKVTAISVAVMEITEEKLAQESLARKHNQLIKTRSALKRSQKKLHLALENGKIGLWEWDLEKNVTTWDHRMEDMFGLERGTYDGNSSTFENLIHEEDLLLVRQMIEKSLRHDDSAEAVFRTKEILGKSKYIFSKALIFKDRNNKPVSVLGVCFDVTEIQEGAERHIVKLNEELLRSNADLQQFAYVASHDLQEPLRMVSSFVQLLQNRYGDKLDTDAKEYIQFAVEGSKRMYELINSLLAYSRVHTRQQEFTMTDLSKVLELVKSNLDLLIRQSNAKIICKELPTVNADPTQMAQVMQNLIENAIKFSTGKPRITIEAFENNADYLIKVTDEGIGIEPQYHDRIFRIFQRLNRSNEYRGTGIGLSICKRIIERHDGKIWVESIPGKGSTFCYTIPKSKI